MLNYERAAVYDAFGLIGSGPYTSKRMVCAAWSVSPPWWIPSRPVQGERPAVEVVAAARDFDGRVPIPHPMVAYQRRRAGLWDR
jgi:hypothetical protein